MRCLEKPCGSLGKIPTSAATVRYTPAAQGTARFVAPHAIVYEAGLATDGRRTSAPRSQLPPAIASGGHRDSSRPVSRHFGPPPPLATPKVPAHWLRPAAVKRQVD